MKFYEVCDEVTPGLRAVGRSKEGNPDPRVLFGFRGESEDGISITRSMVIPLGRSWKRLIVEDDLDQPLFVMEGDLAWTMGGRVLTQKTKRDDDRALVLVHTTPGVGGTVIHSSLRGAIPPEKVVSVPVESPSEKWQEALYILPKGSGLFIERTGELEQGMKRKLILKWNGQKLVDVRRSQKRRRKPRMASAE